MQAQAINSFSISSLLFMKTVRFKKNTSKINKKENGWLMWVIVDGNEQMGKIWQEMGKKCLSSCVGIKWEYELG